NLPPNCSGCRASCPSTRHMAKPMLSASLPCQCIAYTLGSRLWLKVGIEQQGPVYVIIAEQFAVQPGITIVDAPYGNTTTLSNGHFFQIGFHNLAITLLLRRCI